MTNKTYTPPKKDAAPKADAPKAAAPKAAAPAPSKAVTPPPSAKPSQPGAPIVATAKQFSKGGKYRRESLMSFGAYQLSEKKTSVKINPKLKDLEEDCLNEGSCAGHSEGGEIIDGKCTICGMAPKKSLKKEETAYVSQEEVSEESDQSIGEKETSGLLTFGQFAEGLSIDDQMKISRDYNRMSPEEKKAANKKAMGNVKKVPPKKDTRTDAQKMTDATGPRPGSRYRGD